MKAARSFKRGFTFLEMMLSVAIFVLLISTAFTIVAATSQLMAEVSEAQNQSAVRLRFVESCRVAFGSTNRNSSIEFHHFPRNGQTEDTYLSFVNTPKAFDFGFNESEEIERTVLTAEVQPNGFIRSRVYYFTRERFESALRDEFQGIDAPFIELVPRMRQLSWLFFDNRTRRWEPNLDVRFPSSMVKLIIRTEGDSTPLEAVFYHLGR